jgi:hypothetical protein
LVVLVAVVVPTFTVIGPLVAPVGTVAFNCVAVAVETAAVVPLNLTVSLAAVVLKLVPVIVTSVPAGPLPGLKLVIVGAACATPKSAVANSTHESNPCFT